MTSKFIMTFGATLAAALCGLALASPADAAPLLAQFELPAAEDVEFRSPDAQINSAERRRLFRDKMDRIRSHHRPIPVREDAVSFVQPRSARSVDMRSLRRAGRAGAPVIVTRSVITDPQVTTPPIDSRDVSPIAEPSMAVQGKNVLVTYNWGAAWSGDGGRKFIQLDPWRHFSNPAPPLRSEFCCDQTAIYSPDKDLMIWFLQGETSRDNPRQGNNIRLLIAGGKDIASRKWKVRDFTPKTFGLTDIWFDFPDIATTEEHLFISLNMFSVDEKQENRGTIVLRMRLDRLTAADPIKVDRLVDSEMFGVRFAQGSRKTMFWASSETNHSWALGAWSDTAAEPMLGRSAEVEPWNFPREQFTTGSEGPNRLPWLKRVDSRLHTGWATADHVGFAWTSGAMRDSTGFIFRYPHIRVAIFNRSDLESAGTSPVRPVAEPHIFSHESAFAYPAAGVNAAGEVGLAFFFGGGNFYPGAVAGHMRRDGTTWRTEFALVTAGTNTPRCVRRTGIENDCGVWGDYLGVRADPNDPNGWVVAMQTNADRHGDPVPRMAITVARFRPAAPVAAAPR